MGFIKKKPVVLPIGKKKKSKSIIYLFWEIIYIFSGVLLPIVIDLDMNMNSGYHKGYTRNAKRYFPSHEPEMYSRLVINDKKFCSLIKFIMIHVTLK